MTLGTNLPDWLLSTPDSLIYGKISKGLEFLRNNTQNHAIDYAETTLFPNFIPLILSIFGLFYLSRYRYVKTKFENKIVLVSFAVLLLMTIALTTKEFFSLAYNIFPVLMGIRCPSRFEFISYVPFSLFAAYGAIQLRKFKSVKANILTILIIIPLIIIENIHLNSYSNTSNLLKVLSANKTTYENILHNMYTLHVPVFAFDLDRTGGFLSWSTFTDEKMLNGKSGYMTYDWYKIMTQIDNNLDINNLKKLSALNIKYIVIHKNLLSPRLRNMLIKNSGLYKQGNIYEDNNIFIIDLQKLKFHLSTCIPQNDFKFINTGNIENTYAGRYITVMNKSDCYFPSISYNRYKQMNLTYLGKNTIISARFPLLISPFEKTSIYVYQ